MKLTKQQKNERNAAIAAFHADPKRVADAKACRAAVMACSDAIEKICRKNSR